MSGLKRSCETVATELTTAVLRTPHTVTENSHYMVHEQNMFTKSIPPTSVRAKLIVIADGLFECI